MASISAKAIASRLPMFRLLKNEPIVPHVQTSERNVDVTSLKRRCCIVS
jgi:hypothetical protein